MSSRACVPLWGPDAPPLSQRAAELLIREWAELGLIDDEDETNPVKLLQGVRQRAGITATRDGAPHLKLVTTADTDVAGESAPATWPTWEGQLLAYGEVATIGRDSSGTSPPRRSGPARWSWPTMCQCC
jgi:hypothetical protein